MLSRSRSWVNVNVPWWEICVYRNGNGHTGHCPDCRKEEVICSQFTADCGQTSSPREQRRAGEEVAAAVPSCAAECCSHTGPFAEDALLSYKLVINAEFLSLFSLWLGFIIEIKDMRQRADCLLKYGSLVLSS